MVISIAMVASALAQSDAPFRFEVASVKPGVPDAGTSFGIRPGGVFAAANVPVARLIGLAHEIIHDYLIVGGPTWVPEALSAPDLGATETGRGNVATSIPTGTSLTTALREQLGLRLRATTAPTEILVIDSVSPPTPNERAS